MSALIATLRRQMALIAGLLSLALTMLIASGLRAAPDDAYQIGWWTVDGGGGTSAGGGYTLSGSAGQHDAGAQAGGVYTLGGGFWAGMKARTNTPTPTDTPPPPITPSPTDTVTPTPTDTPPPTITPSPTDTDTPTPTDTQTQTRTQTATNTPTDTQTPTRTQTATNTPTDTPPPTITPSMTNTPVPTPSRPWTFMLYLAGDNNLSSYLKRAVSSLERLPANPNLAIVVLYDGPGNGDSMRCLVQAGGSCFDTRGAWSLPLGTEINTGDPDTLASFMTWTRLTYPAQHYYLSIADHGRGTTGIAWDDTDGEDYLTVAELEDAFALGTNNGANPIDVVHYDACLMAMLEDAYLLKDYAGYLVASENLGWSVFAYDQYAQQVPASLQALTQTLASVGATTTPRDLAKGVADAYYNHPALKYYPRTISALDLSQVELVKQKLDALATLLQNNIAAEKTNLLNARGFAQKFDSRDLLRITKEDDYVDLADLAQRITALSSNPAIDTAALDLSMAVTSTLVVAEHHYSGRIYYGSQSSYWDFSGAHGVSIYFPYRHGSLEYDDYIGHQLFASFTSASQWDNFLNSYFGAVGLPSCLFMPTAIECQDVGRIDAISPFYRVHLPQVINQP